MAPRKNEVKHAFCCERLMHFGMKTGIQQGPHMHLLESVE